MEEDIGRPSVGRPCANRRKTSKKRSQLHPREFTFLKGKHSERRNVIRIFGSDNREMKSSSGWGDVGAASVAFIPTFT